MNNFFKIAKKISYKSTYKHKIGAVIVYKNKIISFGCNSMKTHPKSTNLFLKTHAELRAILNARREDFSGHEIYIYRETKGQGKIATAKPCKYCYNLIKSLSFKEIHYSDYKGFISERI